jgi:hypothetical protein
VLHPHVLARHDVALTVPPAVHAEQRAARDVLDVDRAEAALEVGRHALVQEVDDLARRFARPPEARPQDEAGVHRRDLQLLRRADRERLALRRDLTLEVVGVRRGVVVGLGEEPVRRAAEADRATRAHVEHLLDAGARRGAHHVPRPVDAGGDDLAFRVLRPHEEAGGRVVHAPAPGRRARHGVGVEDVAVHDLDVQAGERRGVGRGADHRAHGLAALAEQATNVVADVPVGAGHERGLHGGSSSPRRARRNARARVDRSEARHTHGAAAPAAGGTRARRREPAERPAPVRP